MTLLTSPGIASFASWVEQLIAESTGKEGKGILPVADEPPGPAEVYGEDRVFVYLRLEGDTALDDRVDLLERAGHPVVRLFLNDRYDIGGEFFRWEMATVIVGRRIGINPFDQPNVESAKILARKMVAAYKEQGTLPVLTPTLTADGITIYAGRPAATIREALQAFLSLARGGRSYVCLQAYIQPSPAADAALQALRTSIRDGLRVATTLGYGPRFLHSTGQLHKGDAGNGLFIQFTAKMPNDAPIPDVAGEEKASMTFGVLKTAQALGDRQALIDAGRQVLRIDLGDAVAGSLKILTAIESRSAL